MNFEGQLVQAKTLKNGAHAHTLKLEAPSAFSLVKTVSGFSRHCAKMVLMQDLQVVFTEGEYEGLQAILLRPAKAFAFLKLPDEVRNRIYKWYFAPKGVVGNDIVLEGKRPDKSIYAKTYADGMKDRVALLATNKQIHDEAMPILYAHCIKLESTTTLLDFLSQSEDSVTERLTNLRMKSYIKTSSRNAMLNLAKATNLTRLHIESGVFSEGDPNKAAKGFHTEAGKFLEAIGAKKGDRTAGVDVLSFGKQAFTFKDEKKQPRPWTDDMMEEFKKHLKAKLK